MYKRMISGYKGCYFNIAPISKFFTPRVHPCILGKPIFFLLNVCYKNEEGSSHNEGLVYMEQLMNHKLGCYNALIVLH